jgi:hypothetical protein
VLSEIKLIARPWSPKLTTLTCSVNSNDKYNHPLPAEHGKEACWQKDDPMHAKAEA